MHEIVVHCPRCGSADTIPREKEGDAWLGDCLRCDKPFHATPCPHCGSYKVDGSYGISGSRYATHPATVDCWGCGTKIPARDPGPEPVAER